MHILTWQIVENYANFATLSASQAATKNKIGESPLN